MNTTLSPAAAAVLDAVIRDAWGLRPQDVPRLTSEARQHTAAALRAAANDWRIDTEFIGGVEYIRTTTLEEIASELEAYQ